MKWHPIVLGALIISTFSLTMVSGTPFELVLSESTHSKLIPIGALFFNLNSTNSTAIYTLAQFVPDQSFVGYYNVQIECLLYLDEHTPPCEVICHNVWNASDSSQKKSTADPLHSTYTYSFSQPTAGDPDFSVCLALSSSETITTSPVEGWILLQVVDSGTTIPPPNFTMPEHQTNCTIHSGSVTTTQPGTTNSTNTQPTSILGIVSIFSLSFLMFWRRQLKKKRE
ncbi:MAG: hypothetical protein ACFFBD_02860 [Candidatus Hodarchaeota archaeon]